MTYEDIGPPRASRASICRTRAPYRDAAGMSSAWSANLARHHERKHAESRRARCRSPTSSRPVQPARLSHTRHAAARTRKSRTTARRVPVLRRHGRPQIHNDTFGMPKADQRSSTPPGCCARPSARSISWHAWAATSSAVLAPDTHRMTRQDHRSPAGTGCCTQQREWSGLPSVSDHWRRALRPGTHTGYRCVARAGDAGRMYRKKNSARVCASSASVAGRPRSRNAASCGDC